MAELKARFSLIDEMSEKLSSMAECGQNMIGQWESANNSINSAMDNAASGASKVVSSLNEASNSLNDVNNSASNAMSGTNDFSESMDNLGNAINDTAHNAELLADAETKVSDALSAENDIFSQCEQAAVQLNSEIETAVTAHDDLKTALDQSKQAMDEYADSGKLSAEAQNVLENSSNAVKNAMIDLELAQEDAKRAAEYYNAVIESGTEDTRAYEMAQTRLEKSLDNLSTAETNAKSAADDFSATISNLGIVLSDTTSATDYWTAAAKNYNKSALEAVYSTEQLVEMGYKTADALYTESDIFFKCEEAAGKLNSEMESAASVHDELANSIEQTNTLMSEYADSGKLSAEMQEQLESTGKIAAQAMQELEAAENDAKAAMENYDNVIISGTTDTATLEAAQNRATQAAENLSAAENNAKKAVEDLSKASDEAGKSVDENCKKGVDAFEALADTVIAAKIADTVLDAAKAAYELADAFSEAEKVVVNATGATGEALKGLEGSMMSAYAGHSQDINTTAAAIGEINTRMALTGEELTDVTGKFLDYSRITGSDVVGSVQNVTKVMNQWGVDMDNVESVLDRLAYAGQISGASVDNLSSTLITGAASFQEVGLSLDNTIQLLADFELAGISSTTAVTAMRTAVNNFSKDGLDAKTALQSTITEIANMENASEATAKAVEVFGSRAGQQLAAAIRNGTVSVNSFTATLEAADGTLQTTANAAETLGEKWDKSSNKLKAAFTTALQPAIDKVSSRLATIVGGIGDFLSKHPMLTSAITAIGVGLGVAAVAIAAVTFATKIAIPALTAFGTSLNMALGPIGWIATGATVLVGGITMLSNVFSKAEDEVADYNGTMEDCANEIRRTEAAYEKACELYGENSSAAKELEDNLATLHKQYDKGGGDMQVYIERADKLGQALDEISNSQKQAMEEIDKTETSSLTAIAMLSALSEQSTYTNADLDLMGKYADYLNDTFQCNIEVNYNTGELTGFDPKKLTDIVIKAAEDERYQTAMDVLGGAGLQDGYIEATRNVKELRDKYDELINLVPEVNMLDYEGEWDNNKLNAEIEKTENALTEWEGKLKEATDIINENGAVVDKTGAFTENLFNTLDKLALGTDNVTEATEKHTEALTEEEKGWNAANEAYQQYQSEIEKLCAAYDEVYQSALESFQGQFSLFETASTESETYLTSTVANAQAAMDSQLAYWESYGSNIEQLKNVSAQDLGITQENYDALMSYVQSGSEEAAGLAASMVNNLNDGNKEAVANLANTIGDVHAKQSEIAQTTADWVTDFSGQMDDIVTKMNNTVADMNLSKEANTAATDTITAYTEAIKANGANAVKAAQIIAQQVSNALSSASGSINIDVNGTTPGHAAGTTNAEDVFVAGENGPELIVGKAGSTVFPTSETSKIISAVSDLDGANYTNNNSYLTAQNTAEYSTVNNTEIVNNYGGAQSSYDDSKILYLLDDMKNTFTAMDSKISGEYTPNNSAESGIADTNVSESAEIIVDLSLLDNLISKIKYDNEVNSYSENITYGGAQTIDNSRNYNADYGDTISNFNSSVVEYGDTIRNATESINNIDDSRKYESISGDSFNRYSENAVNYGDTIRNKAETAYIAPVSEEYKTISSYDSELKNSVWAPNNSVYKSGAVYNTDSSSNFSSEIISGDTKTIYDKSAAYQNMTNNNGLSNSFSNNTYDDSIVSIITPFPISKFRESERFINSSQNTLEKYYDSAENNTLAPEIYRDESVIEIPERTNDDRVITADGSQMNYTENSEYSETVSRKELNINFSGEGSVTVHGGMSKEEILEVMWEYAKPVLANIISSEILEEGESSYEY